MDNFQHWKAVVSGERRRAIMARLYLFSFVIALDFVKNFQLALLVALKILDLES
jgi:hypothetical protein